MPTFQTKQEYEEWKRQRMAAAVSGGDMAGSPGPSALPPEVGGWNWGAFFFTWIWGIGNRSYWALLALLPCMNVPMAVVCGLRGNAWAWENRDWDSVDHFRSTQRKWAIAGFVIVPSFVLLLVLSIPTLLKSSDAYKMSWEAVSTHQQVQELLGPPLRPGFFVSGQINASGSDGTAALSYSVKGSKHSGDVNLTADKSGGVWKITRLVVEVPDLGERVVVTSQTASESEPSPGSRAARELNAKAFEAYQRGELDDALRHVQMALEQDPDNAYSFYLSGRIKYKQGHQNRDKSLLVEAEEDYQRSLELEPDREDASRDLEQLHKLMDHLGM